MEVGLGAAEAAEEGLGEVEGGGAAGEEGFAGSEDLRGGGWGLRGRWREG